jgi:hypothetical protein
MRGTLMMDQDHDLMAGTWPDGAETLVMATGPIQVAQAAAQAVSLKQGAIWWNISAGIDYETLFYHNRLPDAQMNPMRAAAFREALLAVEGIEGFADRSDITFDRRNRVLGVRIPCLEIACDESRATATIEVIE